MNNPPNEALVRVPEPEKIHLTWEEQCGYLELLDAIPGEVATFNDSHKFGLRYELVPPASIDGRRDKAEGVCFVVTRRTEYIGESIYCLYSVFMENALHGYLGSMEQGRVRTICKLEPLSKFDEGTSMLYSWLRTLVDIAEAQESEKYF